MLLLVAAVIVEMRAKEPVIPLRLFRDRTTSLATFASIMVGIAMFGSTVYLSQYFQIAQGMSPTHAGLMSIAMVGGLLLSSIATGRIISTTGRWKRFLVGGMVLVVIGLCLLSTIDESTSLVRVGLFMAVLGLGLGATMQNLVLAVQNNTAQRDMGAASSVVAFFRSMGGSIGVAALGAVLSHRVVDGVSTGLARLGVDPSAAGGQSGSIPDMSTLPGPVRAVFEAAFGDATGRIFLIAAPCAAVALIAVLFIREVPLRTTIEREDETVRVDDLPGRCHERGSAGRREQQEQGTCADRRHQERCGQGPQQGCADHRAVGEPEGAGPLRVGHGVLDRPGDRGLDVHRGRPDEGQRRQCEEQVRADRHEHECAGEQQQPVSGPPLRRPAAPPQQRRGQGAEPEDAGRQPESRSAPGDGREGEQGQPDRGQHPVEQGDGADRPGYAGAATRRTQERPGRRRRR